MNHVKAIIFDLDGVICSTDRYHYLAWKALADRLGIPFDEQSNQRLRRISRMESLEIVLGQRADEFPPEDKQALADEKNDVYRSYLQSMCSDDLSKDTEITLTALKCMGYRLAIGSSSKNTLQILNQLGLSEFFDEVADGNQITNFKPDPEVFLLAAELLGVGPRDCIVIEDADSGVQTALAGAFRVIGIRSEGNAPDADITILKLSNILEILSM